jgi:NAD(P)H-dependent FMN reductase
MRAVVLDGAKEGDVLGARVRAAAEGRLRDRGFEVEHIVLREMRVRPCVGDFLCWVRTPGVCMIDDDNRRIAAQVAWADLLVFLTPVVLGGYSPLLKVAMDHLPQNALPFFVKVGGEIHHPRRYAKRADFLALGWLPAPDPRAETVFHRLAARNARGFDAPHTATAVFTPDSTKETLAGAIEERLAWRTGGVDPASDLPDGAGALTAAPPPRKAALLIGSPRGPNSTSYSLGSHLLTRTGLPEDAVKVVMLQSAMSMAEKRVAMEEAVDGADLVVLAFPLYVDSLPAPAIAALEHLASRRPAGPSKRFVAIANCGFPESRQNSVALGQCELFARDAGFSWAGALSLGGGEGLVQGKSMAELGVRARPIAKVLERAAESLARGGAITPEIQGPWDKPLIPIWIYRFAGTLRWNWRARRWGMRKELHRAPYQP